MKVLTENEIWRVAVLLWEEIPCPRIAQVNRITRRVIKMGVSNDFLAMKGSISVGVRDDFFQQTKHGLRRKDTLLVFPAPPASST